MGEKHEVPLLSLENLGAGAGAQLFQHELERVLENILDPNTSAVAKRSVSLQLTITPGEDRRECKIAVKASAKLAPFREVGGQIYVGRKDGAAVATSFDTKQMRMGFDPEGPRVLPSPERARAASGQ